MKTIGIAFVVALQIVPVMAQSPTTHRSLASEYYNTVGDFVRDCGGPTVSLFPCMVAFGVAQNAPGHKYCGPNTSSRVNGPEKGKRKYTALIITVVGWLKRHPEYSSRPYAEGVSVALKSEYPCKEAR